MSIYLSNKKKYLICILTLILQSYLYFYIKPSYKNKKKTRASFILTLKHPRPVSNCFHKLVWLSKAKSAHRRIENL